MIDFLDRALATDVRVALEAHVGSCASCREELEALREAESAACSLPRVTAPQDFMEKLRSALDAEPAVSAGGGGGRAGGPPAPNVIRPRRFMAVPKSFAAAAALLLGATLVVTFQSVTRNMTRMAESPGGYAPASAPAAETAHVTAGPGSGGAPATLSGDEGLDSARPPAPRAVVRFKAAPPADRAGSLDDLRREARDLVQQQELVRKLREQERSEVAPESRRAGAREGRLAMNDALEETVEAEASVRPPSATGSPSGRPTKQEDGALTAQAEAAAPARATGETGRGRGPSPSGDEVPIERVFVFASEVDGPARVGGVLAANRVDYQRVDAAAGESSAGSVRGLFVCEASPEQSRAIVAGLGALGKVELAGAPERDGASRVLLGISRDAEQQLARVRRDAQKGDPGPASGSVIGGQTGADGSRSQAKDFAGLAVEPPAPPAESAARGGEQAEERERKAPARQEVASGEGAPGAEHLPKAVPGPAPAPELAGKALQDQDPAAARPAKAGAGVTGGAAPVAELPGEPVDGTKARSPAAPDAPQAPSFSTATATATAAAPTGSADARRSRVILVIEVVPAPEGAAEPATKKASR